MALTQSRLDNWGDTLFFPPHSNTDFERDSSPSKRDDWRCFFILTTGTLEYFPPFKRGLPCDDPTSQGHGGSQVWGGILPGWDGPGKGRADVADDAGARGGAGVRGEHCPPLRSHEAVPALCSRGSAAAPPDGRGGLSPPGGRRSRSHQDAMGNCWAQWCCGLFFRRDPGRIQRGGG